MTPPPFRAYSHPGLSKAAFLAELQEHATQDRIIQGSYQELDSEIGFRGCAVGCSLHSVQRRLGLASMRYGDHAAFETYLGVPCILAYLEDRIFEGLALADARGWPLRFAAAINPGADLSGVWNQFAPWLLREIALPACPPTATRQREAILAVAEGYETNWSTLTPIAARNQASASAAAADAAYAGRLAYSRMADKLCELLAAVPGDATLEAA